MLETAGLDPLQDSLRLGHTLSLVLDHADDDDGELLSYLSKGHFEKLWPDSRRSSNVSSITACFTKPECAQAWLKLLPATVIQIPSLAERRADIPAFVQRFIRQAEEFTGKRIKPFSAEVMTWLQEREWPGEIRQLKSVVVDASISSMLTESDIKSSLESQIDLWLEQNNIPPAPLSDPLEAAAVLEQCSFRYAVAAARLGLSSKDLYALVRRPLSLGQEKR
jgi:DNA-binding NtrC family response regulator